MDLIKKRIKEILKERGMSMADLSRMLGITPTSLSICINSEFPSLRSLDKMAKVLNVQIEDFFYDNQSKSDSNVEKQKEYACPYCGREISISLCKNSD